MLQGFTYLDRVALLPELGSAVDGAGGWILDLRSLSATTAELRLEVQQQALPSVYGVLSSILTLRVEVHFLAEPQQPTEISRLILMAAATA